jgi:serine protease Do
MTNGRAAETRTLSTMTRDQMFDALAAEAERFEGQNRMVKQLIKFVSPTVAHIEAKKRSSESPSGSAGRRSESIVEEAGSGVVIERSKRFYVVTNFHVIEGSALDDIKVEVGGKWYTPIQVMHDRDTDLSVLSLSGTEWVPARLGDSSVLDIGDFVVAVGSPFGLSHSVSFGIISARERHDLELGPKGVRYQDFIQTDAAINPGNSGGPLFNLRGETVGINTAIASNGGGSDGIGFAIPMNMVTRIVFDLIDYGEVRRGFLGVTLDAKYNYQRAKSLGLDAAYGALVTAVTPHSPAAEAGLEIGDVILEFDNLRVANDSHLVTKVSLAPLDTKVPLEIYRGGRYQTIFVVVKNRKEVDLRSPN